MTRRIALLMTVLALVGAACGTGVESAEVETLAAAAPVVAETAPVPDSGDGEGIKVHGHWTIDIRNPDGSLDNRVEFENALVDDGRSVLLALLRGPDQDLNYTTVNGWSIAGLGTGSVGSDDCSVISSSITAGCTIGLAEPTIVGDTLTLSANNEATGAGEIATVRTIIIVGTMQPADVPPGSVAASVFTEKILGTAIPFVAGQDIEVTVELSFS